MYNNILKVHNIIIILLCYGDLIKYNISSVFMIWDKNMVNVFFSIYCLFPKMKTTF